MKKKGSIKKQIISLIVSLTIVITMMPVSVNVTYAAGGVLINDTNFHDEQFRKYLIDSDFNTDHDTTLTDTEIANATSIEITGDYNVTDLYGIDKLTSLEEIRIYNNTVKNVDLSVAPWIQAFIYCDSILESLNLSGCSDLTYLEIYGNNLSSLNLKDCTSLSYLVCNNNKLENLDISNTALLEDNHVPFIGSQKNDIKIRINMTTKQRMAFTKFPQNEYNQNIIIIDPSRPEGFVTIDETNFPDGSLLKKIKADKLDKNSDNMLSTEEIAAVKAIDLSGIKIADTTGLEIFTELETLIVDNVGLTKLDVSPFTKLKKLSFKDNNLSYISLDKNSLLEELYCDNNKLTYLDLTNNKNLTSLTCSDNLINELDITGTKVATVATVKCALGYSGKDGVITIKMTDAQSNYFYTNIVTKENVSGNKGISNHPHDARFLISVAEVEPTENEYGVKSHFKCSYCGQLFEDVNGKIRIDDIENWKENEGRIDKIEIDKTPLFSFKIPVPVAGKEGRFPAFETSKDIHMMAVWFEPKSELLYPNEEYYQYAKNTLGIDLKIAKKTFDTFEAGKKYELAFMFYGNDLPKTECIFIMADDKLIELDWVEEVGVFAGESYDITRICEENHEHSLSSEWSKDATGHWKECICGERFEETAHTFKWIIDKEATTTSEGSKHEECEICGYKSADVVIDKLTDTTPTPSPTPSPVPSDDTVIPTTSPAPALRAQKITTAKIKAVKVKTLKKKAVKIKLKAKADGNGKLTYKVTKYPKKMKKYIKVSKKGVVTLKKNAKKGVYKIAITAASKGDYDKATKVVKIVTY